MLPIQEIDFSEQITYKHKENYSIYSYREVVKTLKDAASICNALFEDIMAGVIKSDSNDLDLTGCDYIHFCDNGVTDFGNSIENSNTRSMQYGLVAFMKTLISGRDIYAFPGTREYKDALEIHANHESADYKKCLLFTEILYMLSSFKKILYNASQFEIEGNERKLPEYIKFELKEYGPVERWRLSEDIFTIDINIEKFIKTIVMNKEVMLIVSRHKVYWKSYYKKLRRYVKKNHNLIEGRDNGYRSFTPDYKREIIQDDDFFTNGKIRNIFLNKEVITRCDLSNIHLENKDISEMDFSDNLEINIPFDKIEKRLVKTNLEGYNMKNVILDHFDLTGANLKNTSAGIDLLTCIVTIPSKSSLGTLFDEGNRFYWGGKKIDAEKVKKLKLNIERRNNNE